MASRRAPKTSARTPRRAPRTPKPAPQAPPPREAPREFRLGVIAGASVGTWVDRWRERMPHVALEIAPLEFPTSREALGAVDLALVRLPLDDDDLHVIRLYDETPVVVAAADSHLMAAEELAASDLEGETLFVPADSAFGDLDIAGTVPARGARIEHTADAIATAASGVGIVVVPMSLARLHHRKDADYRPLRGGPVSTVALVWPRERTTPDVEAFVGIVRGRTANSSR